MAEWFAPLSSSQGGGLTAGNELDLAREFIFPAPVKPRGSGAFRRLPRSNEDAYQRWSQVSAITRSEQRLDFSERGSVFAFQVPLRRLPLAFERLSILFLSDIHLNRDIQQRTEELLALVEFFKTRKIQPDVLALGGDVIDLKRSDLNPQVLSALAGLAPQERRFAVLGNHDYYGKSEKIVRESLAGAGFTVLENDCRSIVIEGARINFFGLGYKLQGRAQLSPCIAERGNETNVLLTHTLDNVTGKIPDAFDLILSGHYHGGEIKLGPISGLHFLRIRGLSRDINHQIEGWDMLTDRALSYVSPGFARHRSLLYTCRPGAALLELRIK